MKKCGSPRNQSNYINRKVLTRAIQKVQVLSNLSNFFKRYEHLSEILAFLTQALTKYG